MDLVFDSHLFGETIIRNHFGEEAEELLHRHSGDPDKPRILGTFNEPISDWLSFFMFTFFTDRDGKFQLKSLAESGFDPLSRTCRFMLTEEAHHMFVGETGIGRTVQSTCEAMKAAGIEDPNDVAKVRALGVIDLPTLKKKLKRPANESTSSPRFTAASTYAIPSPRVNAISCAAVLPASRMW